ncbi:hypothetical protein KUTeg_012018 [Tegillarca granosa]|uniref:Uncharacterized protein n=1 Tax=Tegillarca granosa TaxID=220873 RepID=A0ABQ9F3K7_TEGGR|nr:hypothetical protein KUTeg_012018 [Tegillarca granosa]
MFKYFKKEKLSYFIVLYILSSWRNGVHVSSHFMGIEEKRETKTTENEKVRNEQDGTIFNIFNDIKTENENKISIAKSFKALLRIKLIESMHRIRPNVSDESINEIKENPVTPDRRVNADEVDILSINTIEKREKIFWLAELFLKKVIVSIAFNFTDYKAFYRNFLKNIKVFIKDLKCLAMKKQAVLKNFKGAWIDLKYTPDIEFYTKVMTLSEKHLFYSKNKKHNENEDSILPPIENTTKHANFS